MATKTECAFCAPHVEGKPRGDRLCVSCLNKAAAFDDLKSEYDDLKAGVDDLRIRLTTVGQMLRHALKSAPAGSLVLAEIMVALDFVQPEMDAMDAQDARIAAWRAAPYGTATEEASQVLQDMLHGTGELTP